MPRRQPRIGLALGSGSARGWAHIGVIRVLERAGVVPDIICGTSIGALVGAAYAAGDLDRLESWVKTLTWQGIVALVDFSMDGGLIKGDKVLNFFRTHFRDQDIEQLARPFGAVATELETGREVWLREGSVVDAVRASLALPGLFTPALREDVLLVDGALVNPVPVSLCRAMGADIVIAVDLTWNLINRRLSRPEDDEASPAGEAAPERSSLLSKLPFGLGRLAGGASLATDMPSVLDVLATSLNIMQVRITNSRLAGEPADVIIRPRTADIALMDYHRAAITIDEGRRAAELALPAVAEATGRAVVTDSPGDPAPG